MPCMHGYTDNPQDMINSMRVGQLLVMVARQQGSDLRFWDYDTFAWILTSNPDGPEYELSAGTDYYQTNPYHGRLSGETLALYAQNRSWVWVDRLFDSSEEAYNYAVQRWGQGMVR